MDINLLNRELEVTDNPGLDTMDPRFNDIATDVQAANYIGAATQAQALLEQGVFDIRIIGYFLYGFFIEQGLASLAQVFECLSGLLRDNWEAFGPVQRKEDIDNIIANFDPRTFFPKLFARYSMLLVLNIGERRVYEEQKESPEWQVLKAFYQVDLDGFIES